MGYVPIEISRISWYFLERRTSHISCKITDKRKLSEKGLEVPCTYLLTGEPAHVQKLIQLFLRSWFIYIVWYTCTFKHEWRLDLVCCWFWGVGVFSGNIHQIATKFSPRRGVGVFLRMGILLRDYSYLVLYSLWTCTKDLVLVYSGQRLLNFNPFAHYWMW